MIRKFINTIKTLTGLSYVHLHAVYSVLGHIHCIPGVEVTSVTQGQIQDLSQGGARFFRYKKIWK